MSTPTYLEQARAFLARRKAQHLDFRMEADAAQPPAPAPPPAPAAVDQPPAPKPTDVPRGPGSDATKPVAEMTDAEKADYYSRKSDRLAERFKPFDGLTAEELAELRTKADRADALERDLMTDQERAIDAARQAAREEALTEAREQYLGVAVTASLRAAAGDRLTDEQFEGAAGFLNLTKFITTDGAIDNAAVKAWADSVAPRRSGPSPAGLGDYGRSPAAPGSQGREMAQRRFGTGQR